jgi:hypothetical protein
MTTKLLGQEPMAGFSAHFTALSLLVTDGHIEKTLVNATEMIHLKQETKWTQSLGRYSLIFQ